jgi:hypothetical protein
MTIARQENIDAYWQKKKKKTLMLIDLGHFMILTIIANRVSALTSVIDSK